MRDTSGLIKLVCNGDMPNSMFRKALTIEETVMAYQEYELAYQLLERSALNERSSDAVSNTEATQ